MRAIIVGGGAFARELTCWASDAASLSGAAAPSAYLDDAGDEMAAFDYGLTWLGPVDEYRPKAGDVLLLGVGDPSVKAALVEKLGGASRFGQVIHPHATISRTAKIGAGVIIGPQTYVAADAHLDDMVTVNSLTGIGHDVQVGSFSTISSQVDLMGGVFLGAGAFIGSGARILPKVKIGEGAKVGAGAVVVRQVKAGASVFAAPAKAL